MRINPALRGIVVAAATMAGVAATTIAAEPMESEVVLSSATLEFAGRVARNYWYLFGDTNRSNLESINRDLRGARQEWDRSRDAQGRSSALVRAADPAARLLRHVKENPNLLRIDLGVSGLRGRLEGAVELPGDTGALLLEVIAGGKGEYFHTQLGDLGLMPGETSVFVFEGIRAGTNYVLLGLENIPSKKTTLGLEFRLEGKDPIRLPLDVVTPSPGRLNLTVLSDDTGKPAPAMMQIKWLTDGVARQPGYGNGIAQQFENQGQSASGRRANLPGIEGEPFWCVPGPVDKSLAPGKWQVTVRRGVEHEIVVQDIIVRSGETTASSLRPRRWTDMRKRGWWSGDDHVHWRLLSEGDAQALMDWVQAEDIHLANVVKMGDIYRTYFEQRGFGPEFRVVRGEYVLVPGQECPRTHDQLGHTLAMNITGLVRDTERYYLYDEIFDAVHAQGGLSGYAHVNSGLFHVHRDMSINVPRQKVDFAEILQFNKLGTDLYYEFLNLGCKLTASAGSDVPWGGTIGEVRVYSYLGKRKFSADAWFEAFRRGHTFATSGPMLDLRVDDALPGDEIRVAKNRKLRVRASAWGDPERMGKVVLEIVRHGEVIHSCGADQRGTFEAAADITVDSGDGCWIAARATAGDGTTAHTTPVYVIREGLRFWKYSAVDELIAKRSASLAELDIIIAEARRLDAEGKLEKDRNRKQLALQSTALEQRVSQARAVYQEFKRLADSERGSRSNREGNPAVQFQQRNEK